MSAHQNRFGVGRGAAGRGGPHATSVAIPGISRNYFQTIGMPQVSAGRGRPGLRGIGGQGAPQRTGGRGIPLQPGRFGQDGSAATGYSTLPLNQGNAHRTAIPKTSTASNFGQGPRPSSSGIAALLARSATALGHSAGTAAQQQPPRRTVSAQATHTEQSGNQKSFPVNGSVLTPISAQPNRQPSTAAQNAREPSSNSTSKPVGQQGLMSSPVAPLAPFASVGRGRPLPRPGAASGHPPAPRQAPGARSRPRVDTDGSTSALSISSASGIPQSGKEGGGLPPSRPGSSTLGSTPEPSALRAGLPRVSPIAPSSSAIPYGERSRSVSISVTGTMSGADAARPPSQASLASDAEAMPAAAEARRAHTIATSTHQPPSATSGGTAGRQMSNTSGSSALGTRPEGLHPGAPSPALRRADSAIKRLNSGVFSVDKHAVSLTLSTASIAPQNKPAQGGAGLPGAASRFSGRASDASGRRSISSHSRPALSPEHGSSRLGHGWASARSDSTPALSPTASMASKQLDFNTSLNLQKTPVTRHVGSVSKHSTSPRPLKQAASRGRAGEEDRRPPLTAITTPPPLQQTSHLLVSTHPYLRSLYSYDARGTDLGQLHLGQTSGQWLFGHRREPLVAEALTLSSSAKFAIRFARMREFRRLMTKLDAPQSKTGERSAGGAAAGSALSGDTPSSGSKPMSRMGSRAGMRQDSSVAAFTSPQGTPEGHTGADSISLTAHGVDLSAFTNALREAPPTVVVPGQLRPLISAPDAPPFGGPLLPEDISQAYYAEEQFDPLDSARSELAVDMSRVALEAMACNMQFVVSNEIVGTFDESSTPAKANAGKKDAAAAEHRSADPRRSTSSSEAPGDGSGDKSAAAKPRYVSKAEERAAKRAAKKEARRVRALERERAREAEERRLMRAEEWEQQRAIWWKGRSLESSWRTVRVFVSSTFNDFHGERDALTRVVFPALNNRAKSRRVRVVPVDLRWGLTAEDTSDSGLGALEHCLLEIETSRPFFMALLGERYGWIPPNYRVSETKEFQWVRSFEVGHSITAMEIYHGFLRKQYTPVHALVYNRDAAFIEDIPDTKNEQGWSRRGVFAWDYPGQEDVHARRDQLRQDCADHPYSKYRTYNTQYGGEDEEGKPTVTGLAEFESMVLEDLWEAVKAEFPPPPPPPSELAVERAYHLHFVENRSQNFIGRRKLLKTLEGVADQDNKGATLPFVVVGAPGSGKTSLVTAFAKQYMTSGRNCFVLVHVVSASPSSTDIREVLLRLCHEFAERFDLPRAAALDENDDYQKIKEAYADTLIEAGKCAKRQGGHVLLVIDAINQLNTFYGAHTMDWCPPYSPAGVITLLSSTPDSPPLYALMKRDPQPQQMNVPGLQLEDRQEIVRKSLLEYSKRLKPDQMDLIMQKPESTKPLYLLTVCEELRLQAQYGEAGSGVDSKIRELPGEIPDLLHVVLLRVERDLSTWAEHAGGAELAPAAITVAGLGDPSAPPPPPSSTALATAEEGDDRAQAAAKAAQLAVTKAAAERVGYFIVRDALSLLVCSRHGLSEDELLEMLAPPGKAQLPPVVWARLYRSLELYLRPVGDDAQGLLGFFHEQMVFAVQRRYLASNARMATAVSARLLEYFSTKADSNRDLQYRTSDLRYVQDMVYYQLRAHRYADLYRTLGCIQFIQRRASNGPGSMEHLLRDYHDAMEDLRTVRYSAMKDGMAAKGTGPGTSSVLAGQGSSSEDDAGGASRAQLLQWVGEFLVFVGSAHAMMVEYPWLTFQQASNQPTLSAPALVARDLLDRDCRSLMAQMDKRTRTIKDLARTEFERLVEPLLAQLAPPPTGGVSPNAAPRTHSHTRSPVSGRTGTIDSPVSQLDESPRPRSESTSSQSTGVARSDTIKTELALATRVLPQALRQLGFAQAGVGASKKASSALVLLRSPQAAGIRRRLERLAGATAWALRRVAQGLQPKHTPRRHLVWCNKPRRNLIVADFAGYVSKVTAISLSPDNDHIAIGFQDGTLNIVDAGTGETVRECSIGGHSDGITCLQYSSDGLRLVSGSFDCQVIIWDALTGTRLSGLDDHEDVITAVTWLDPEHAGSSSTGGRRGRKSVAVKSGSRMLATASMDCTVVIWEEARGGRYGSYSRSTGTSERALRRERKRQERDAGGAAVFSGDQLRYDVIYEDSLPERPVLSIAYDPIFKTLFLGMMRDGDVMMLDATAPSLGVLSAGKFTAHKYVRGVTAIAVSPDGRTLCTSSNSTPNTSSDHSLKLWTRSMSASGDIQWMERPVSGADHSKVITAVDFSSGGTHFLSCSMDKKLFIYDAESGQQVMTLTGHADSVYCASFMHNKLQVVSGSHDKSVKIWSLSGAEESTKRTEVKKASHQGHRALSTLAGVGTADASLPASALIPSSTRGDRLDKRRQSLMSQNMPLAALSGAAGSRRKGSLPTSIEESDKLSPIAGASSQPHDISTRVRVISGSHADRVTVSLVSADGCVAITGSADKTLKVWDITEDGRDALTLVGHNATVTSLYLSPDRRLLVSGDADGNLLLWSGLTFDHFHSIHAHSEKRITSITVVDVVRVPGNVRTPNVSTGLIVFSGAEDGSIKAWRAFDGRPWEIKPPTSLHTADFPVMAMQFVAAATLPMPPAAQPAPINSGLLQSHHIDPTLSVTPQAGVLPGRGLAPIGGPPPSPAASFRQGGAFNFNSSSEKQTSPAIPGGVPVEVHPEDALPPCFSIRGLSEDADDSAAGTTGIEIAAAAAAAAALESKQSVSGIKPRPSELRPRAGYRPTAKAEAAITDAVVGGGAHNPTASHTAAQDRRAHQALRELFPISASKLPADVLEASFGPLLPSDDLGAEDEDSARTPSNDGRRRRVRAKSSKTGNIESGDKMLPALLGGLLVPPTLVSAQPRAWDDAPLLQSGEDPLALVPGWTPPGKTSGGNSLGIAASKFSQVDVRPDRIFSMSGDGQCVVWDLFRGTVLHTYTIPHRCMGMGMAAAAVAPHAARVAVAPAYTDITARVSVMPGGNLELATPVPLDGLATLKAVRVVKEDVERSMGDPIVAGVPMAKPATAPSPPGGGVDGSDAMLAMGSTKVLAGGVPITITDLTNAKKKEVKRMTAVREQNIQKRSSNKVGRSTSNLSVGTADEPVPGKEDERMQFQLLGEGGPITPLLKFNGGVQMYKRESSKAKRSAATKFGRYTATESEEAAAAAERLMTSALAKYEAKKERQRRRDARVAEKRRRAAARARKGGVDEDEDDLSDDGEDSDDEDPVEGSLADGSAAGEVGEDALGELDEEWLHKVSAMAFSSDGTLLVTGTEERLVTISDPSRPHLGPLAQFVTTSGVTTIGAGPGVMPWPEPAEEVSQAQRQIAALTGVHPRHAAAAHTVASVAAGGAPVEPGGIGRSLLPPPSPINGSAGALISGAAVGGAAAAVYQQFRDLASDSPDLRDLIAPGAYVAGLKRLSSSMIAHTTEHARRSASTPSTTPGTTKSTPLATPHVKVPSGAGMDREANEAVFQSMKTLTEHTLRQKRPGDGKGCLGVVVAGDSTGQVFILKLSDTVRAAEALRDEAVVQQELKSAQETHSAMLANEALVLHSDSPELGPDSSEAASLGDGLTPEERMVVSAPISHVHFDNGRTGDIVSLPRRLHRDTEDELLVENVLKRLGMQVDELCPDPIPPRHSQELLAALPLRPAERGEGLQALYEAQKVQVPPGGTESDAELLPFAVAIEAAARKGGVRLVASEPRSTRTKRRSGQTPGRAPPGKPARPLPPDSPPSEAAIAAAISAPSEPPQPNPFGKGVSRRPEELLPSGSLRLQTLRARYFARPTALVCVFGGAGGLHDLLVPRLRGLIKRGATVAAMAVGGMVLDGGTDAGVMSMIGQGLEGIHQGALRVLGVSPAGLVYHPTRKAPLRDLELIREQHGDEAAEEAAAVFKKLKQGAGGSGKRSPPAGGKGAAAGAAAPSLEDDSDEDEAGDMFEEDDGGAAEVDPNKAPLEPHHSHFFLAPTDEWGGETSTMFTVTCVLRRRLPTIAVLANGGFISMKEIHTCVQLNIPVIAIEGSGRLADKIAQAISDHKTLSAAEWERVKADVDKDVVEIIEGDITLFPVTGSAPALQDVILAKLQEQRTQMMAGRTERKGVTVATEVGDAEQGVAPSAPKQLPGPPPQRKRPGMSIKIEGGNLE